MALLLSLAICVSLFAGLVVHAAGYTPKYTEAAETLYEFGLFKGMGKNADGTPKFALEQKATRLQGLVMLLRLLGKEDEALAYTGSNPFTDVPDWGKPYVGYAYENKLTKGTSATTFTPDGELLGKAYLTFVLRALGYDDAAGDFSYNEALAKAKELRLITEDTFTGALYRDDCVIVSLKALTTDMKDGKQTLAEKLVLENVLPDTALEPGVLTDALAPYLQTFYAGMEIPVECENGKGGLDYHKILAIFPETYLIHTWSTSNQEKRVAGMSNPYRYFLSNVMIHNYLNYGEALSQSNTFADGESWNGDKDRIVFIDLFDKDFNLIAYAAATADGSKVYPTTVCVEKYMDKAKAELQALKNVPTLRDDTVYMERTVTFGADGSAKFLTLLRLHKDRISFAESQVAKYDLYDNSAQAVTLQDTWYGLRARNDLDYYRDYGVHDMTRGLQQWIEDTPAKNSRALVLVDADQNILAFASVKSGFELKDYADFGNGKVACTISEEAALDILNALANDVGGAKMETAILDPYSDAALTKIIYLYRTGISSQAEYVESITAWMKG